MIKVLGLNIKHDGMLRVEIDEGAIALVAFRHKMLPRLVPPSVGAQQGDFRADIMTRTQTGFAQDMGHHRRGRRLAVRAANNDSFFPFHDGR